MKKIFDALEEQEKEQEIMSNFERGLSSLLGKYADRERKTADQKITEDVKSFMKSEIDKIKPIQNVIERKEIPVPKQKIKEIVQEVIAKEEKEETKQYAE